MVRVLFVNHTAQLGGAEHCLVDMARLLGGRGQVALLSEGPLRKRLEDRGVPVRVLAGTAGLDRVRKQAGIAALGAALPAVWADAGAVAQAAREFDLIWANTHKAFVVSALAGFWVRKPVIYHLHDMLDAGHFSAGNRRAMVFLANTLARRVVANSRATALSFVAQGGRSSLLEILYNGFEFGPAAAPAAQGQARFVIGIFSRLTNWKGQHILLEAMTHLDPCCHALLVGDALFAEDQAYLERLKEQVERLGLQDRVQFLGYRHDAPALMATCDVLVHCSILPEAFGRVVVEGMATGRPVIAVRAGGVPEIMEDGRTGLLVPPGDVSALAAAITRLQTDPELARRLGEAGRLAVQERFALKQIGRDLERILDHLDP